MTASSGKLAAPGRGVAALMGAALILAGCRPTPPRPVAPGLPTTEPVVRIGIAVDVPSVSVSASSRFELGVANGAAFSDSPAGETWTFEADGTGRLTARRAVDGATLGPLDGPVRVTPAAGGTVSIDGRSYRGTAEIRVAGAGRVTAVNVVALEEYLLGVVPREIPAMALEAVKAQAVAARTYAIGHLGARRTLGFDFYATVADQVYGGTADENAMASQAVRETRGQILLYDGLPILAYYHSTCGGRTAAIEDVWRRAPLPYLRSESDMVPGTNRAYCDISGRYRWDVVWNGAQLRAALAAGLREHLGTGVQVDRIEDIAVVRESPSGRAETLSIRINGRDYQVRGDSIRWVLRPEPSTILNSSMLLSVDARRDAGVVEELHVHGGGWGHGIGMCQFGAIGRAQAGQDYQRILRAYYRGVDIVRLY